MIGKVSAQFPHVVLGAVYEARFAAAQKGQPEDIQAGRIDDPPIVPELAFAVEYRDVQP